MLQQVHLTQQKSDISGAIHLQRLSQLIHVRSIVRAKWLGFGDQQSCKAPEHTFAGLKMMDQA